MEKETSSAKDPDNSSVSAEQNNTLAGILFLLLGATLFSIQDVIIKSLSDRYAVHQIVFLRGLFALPIVAAIAHFDRGIWPLRLGSVRLQLIRAGGAFTSYIVYYMALATLGLAETAAITFSTPIFVTIFAMFVLGEKIGAFRWAAIVIGLLGVLVIVRPGSGIFEPAALLALAAAITYAISIIATRKLGRTSNGGSMTLFMLLFFIVAGGGLGLIFNFVDGVSPHPSLSFLYRKWVWPQPEHWAMIFVIGCISAIGFFALTQAYRLAEASIVTPFEYTYLPWAVLWGYVFFGSLPDVPTWIGLSMIVGGGLLIVAREATQKRKKDHRKGLGVMRQR